MSIGSHRMIGALAALAAVGLLAGVASGQRSSERKRGEFMRQKLVFSQGILEGLALEDYGQIEDNARKLKVLSQAAEWEVPSIPNVEMYVPYTTEFQRLCDDLAARARSRNVDGATLSYMALTMNCVNCHKYVRGARP